jgi:hypothetical protein
VICTWGSSEGQATLIKAGGPSDSLEAGTYVKAMAKGWKISAVRPGRGASGAMRQELFLVAIPDKVEAVRACLPDAEVKIDSEASPNILAEYQVNDGEMFVLPEGS